ncbi:pentapeptide repeat-containing protein [Flagellimonas marinaquae]|uniref:pentapeptide repeat-containing protein n=1 Tax=Flagellimonas marinaquae TaxID=254955 RepID=UPI000F8E7EFB|nr:pentapeptide repeat-containing protein [Allomuricauda aquimarina]
MEELIPVNSEKELEELFKQNYFKADEDFYFGVKNLAINFPLTLPISEERIIPKSAIEERQVGFSINNSKQHFAFSNCKFDLLLEFKDSESNLHFDNCQFNGVDAENKHLSGKIRFRECHFYNWVNFRNTTFYELADFWRSIFYPPTIFFKTEFIGTTVFSATTFKENVLFTYSLIDKLILFRGTKIEKGFDISTAIRSGEMGIFDFHVQDFKSLNKKLDEEAYERAIAQNAEIPIKNKRETFRILKQEHISQNNVVHSIEYKTLENETYLKENISKLLRGESIVSCVSNLFVLSLNWLSSRFGVSYFQAAFFTLIFGGLFYYFTILSTSKYEMAMNFDWNIFYENIPTYSSYLLPTHRFDFLGEEFGDKYSFNNWFYFFDLFGRIVTGYGIYQTIQAFRKFR